MIVELSLALAAFTGFLVGFYGFGSTLSGIVYGIIFFLGLVMLLLKKWPTVENSDRSLKPKAKRIRKVY